MEMAISSMKSLVVRLARWELEMMKKAILSPILKSIIMSILFGM